MLDRRIVLVLDHVAFGDDRIRIAVQHAVLVLEIRGAVRSAVGLIVSDVEVIVSAQGASGETTIVWSAVGVAFAAEMDTVTCRIHAALVVRAQDIEQAAAGHDSRHRPAGFFGR
jgi:hypothetical protein